MSALDAAAQAVMKDRGWMPPGEEEAYLTGHRDGMEHAAQLIEKIAAKMREDAMSGLDPDELDAMAKSIRDVHVKAVDAMRNTKS